MAIMLSKLYRRPKMDLSLHEEVVSQKDYSLRILGMSGERGVKLTPVDRGTRGVTKSLVF